MRKHLKRFADSGIETAIQYFWTAVIIMIIAVATALWYYLSGSSLFWQLVWYGAGFISACVLIIGLSRLSTFIKARRVERAQQAKFTSQEKGFLDHWVSRNKALEENTKTLSMFAKELDKITSTTGRSTRKVSNAGLNAVKRLKLASENAVKMNKHAAKLEKYATKFEETTNLLIESDMGFVSWYMRTAEHDREGLTAFQNSCSTLIESVRGSLVSMEQYRETYMASKGTSQDLNTVANRMVHVIERIITVHQKTEKHYQELVRLVDAKLSGSSYGA